MPEVPSPTCTSSSGQPPSSRRSASPSRTASSSPCSALRLRQVDHAQLHRRPRAAHRRPITVGGTVSSTRPRGVPAARGAQPRHGVPVLRAMATHDRRRQPGVPLKPQGAARTSERRRIDEVLDQVGLADIKDRYPHQMSGGQQQRVALARALVYAPGCCCSTSRCPTSTPSCANRPAPGSSASRRSWASPRST